MSKKCKAYSESKLGLIPHDNQKAFYAGWDAAMAQHQPRKPLTDEEINGLVLPESGAGTVRDLVRIIEAAHGIGGEE